MTGDEIAPMPDEPERCTTVWHCDEFIEMTPRGVPVRFTTAKKYYCPNCQTWLANKREAVAHLKEAT